MKPQPAKGRPSAQDPLQVVHVPLEDLTPADYNPRAMPEDEMEKLKRSIERFGLVEPIVVRKRGNLVIGGHQRLEAARQLGHPTVPVVFVDVTDHEAKLLNLALNKIQGRWDTMRLAALLQDLRTLPTSELEISGFVKAEASAIIRALDWTRRPSSDDIPDAPEAPTAKPDDIWQLGDHHVLCADCTDAAAVRRLLSGSKIDLLLSDPPYGISYDPGSRPGSRISGRKIEGDSLSDEDYRLLLQKSLHIALEAAPQGAAAYVFHASTRAETVLAAFKAAGWHLAACLVWVKAAPTFGRSDYRWQHEPIVYGWKPGGRHRWYGGRSESTVWDSGRDAGFPYPSGTANAHPTRKPVALFERAISNSSRPGETMYDPFLGSGTTVIACERLARRCLAVEIDPRFVDVAVRRWENYTRKGAQLMREG